MSSNKETLEAIVKILNGADYAEFPIGSIEGYVQELVKRYDLMLDTLKSTLNNGQLKKMSMVYMHSILIKKESYKALH